MSPSTLTQAEAVQAVLLLLVLLLGQTLAAMWGVATCVAPFAAEAQPWSTTAAVMGWGGAGATAGMKI
jgi:hypothetical protein